jgi:alkyl sulfatase BDS1-like metallo-beta-lactamase superfamily hydrolase
MGPVALPPGGFSPDVLAATTTAMLLDFAAVRVNPEKAAAQAFKLNIELTDRQEKLLITVGNGVLVHEHGVSDGDAGASLAMSRPAFLMALFMGQPLERAISAGEITVEGEPALFQALVDLIEPLTANFPIVTP